MLKKQAHISLRSTAFSALLCFVICFNLAVSSLHVDCAQHNDTHEQTCSAENEFDACHRYLVHHESSASCDGSHKHLSSAHSDCFVCKYHKQRNDLAFVETPSFVRFTEQKINYISLHSNFQSQKSTQQHLRGPPTVS